MNGKEKFLAILSDSASEIEKISKNGFNEAEKINLKLNVILKLSKKISDLKFNQRENKLEEIKSEILALKSETLAAIENQNIFSKALVLGIESGFGCRVREMMRRAEKICL